MALNVCAATSAEHNCKRWAHALSTRHECNCGHRWHQDAASRQAGAETRDGQVRQTELGDHDTLHRLGLAVLVGTLVPAEAGAAVRLDFLDQSMWLEPEEAKRLSIALDIAALEAVHEDRAARRG